MIDINTLEVVRNILFNYTVSSGTIKAATDVGLAFLIIMGSTAISAGLKLNIYNNTKYKNKTLFIEKINKLKSKIRLKKKEHS